MTYDYDIIFLGGGLNYAGAVVASKAGLKTALVEKNMEHIGGTCLHNGCIPSKMYLHAADTIRNSRHSFFKGDLSLDMKELHQKKEAMLGAASKAITMQCSKVDLIADEGILSAPYTIQAGNKTITAEYIIIGTGSSPFIPEGIEFDGKSIISSDEVLNMQELPEKVSVYGDGAIGMEMASFFAAAGVETELIWRHDSLLRNAHPMISSNMKKQLEKLGIAMVSNHSIKSAKATQRGVHIIYGDGKEHYTPTLLVATGRHPNLDAVKCDDIAINRKGIETNRHFETSLKNHYAIGDCNGKIQLAHAARAEVLYVVKRILDKNPETIDINNIVKFIHALPMGYAYVGKNKSILEANGTKYKESVVPLQGLPYPHINDADLGMMITYSDEEGFIVGGEILSPNAEELIGIVAMALAGEMDATLAKHTILAHPTFSESLEKSFLRL